MRMAGNNEETNSKMNILIVTSDNNPQVKEMAALLTARGRRKSGTFLVEGFKVVREAVLAGLPVRRLAVQNEVIESDRTRELLRMEQLKNVQVMKVPRVLIKKLSAVETPQGIVAEVKRPEAAPAEPPETGVSLACECIQDPRNLGMLVRTAHAAGVKHVFLGQGSVDSLHPHVVNSSAGSIFHVAVHPDCAMPELLKAAKKKGAEIWATAATGGEPLQKAAAGATGGIVLLFGNEGAGLSPELLKMADRRVTIPMPGGAESLNIAAAAAVMMFYILMKNS
jgi:TrmH family RNA methyltransferase